MQYQDWCCLVELGHHIRNRVEYLIRDVTSAPFTHPNRVQSMDKSSCKWQEKRHTSYKFVWESCLGHCCYFSPYYAVTSCFENVKMGPKKVLLPASFSGEVTAESCSMNNIFGLTWIIRLPNNLKKFIWIFCRLISH